MARGRNVSAAFNLQVIQEYDTGGVALSALAKKYERHPNLILEWRRKARRGDLVDQTPQLRAKEKEIQPRRALVGKLTLEMELLKNARGVTPRQRNGTSFIISGPVPAPSDKDVR